MYKLYISKFFKLSCIILLLNISCVESKQTSENNLQAKNSKEFNLTVEDINQLKYTEFVLSDLSKKGTKGWLKFQELQEEILVLKKGDFSFFKNDKAILQSLITDLKNEIPEELNTHPILVRLSVLETTTFKLEGTSNINKVKKELLLKAIKEVLVAYSNVILQINKKIEKDSQNIQKPN